LALDGAELYGPATLFLLKVSSLCGPVICSGHFGEQKQFVSYAGSFFSVPNALPWLKFWILFVHCILFIILCFVSLSSSCAFPFQITDCMLRTIHNVVNMTADVYKTPYLKIDLMCEESGIEAVPKVPDIIAIYHKIINDVSASV
jgi:hypothetical protein